MVCCGLMVSDVSVCWSIGVVLVPIISATMTKELMNRVDSAVSARMTPDTPWGRRW